VKTATQGIDGKMSFDAIGAFVMTKPFGLNTAIAGILHCLQSMMSKRVHFGFDLLSYLHVQSRHDLF